MAMYLRICLHGGAEGRKELYGNDNLKGYLGITEILKVELMHRIADTYGPLVYHQLGETPRVYGLQEAYTRFFADLDEGQQLIREYLTRAVTTTNSKSMIC